MRVEWLLILVCLVLVGAAGVVYVPPECRVYKECGLTSPPPPVIHRVHLPNELVQSRQHATLAMHYSLCLSSLSFKKVSVYVGVDPVEHSDTENG